MGMTQSKSAPTRRGFTFKQFKASDEAAGTFEGYLAVIGNIDLGADVIEPGSMDKTLTEMKARRASRVGTPAGRYLLPIFWAHDDKDPIGGVIDARIDAHGLWVKGELDMATEQGKRAHSGLARGYLSGLSIGYFPVKFKYDREGVRHLNEISIFECTVTAIPMNPEALVMDVKNTDNTGAPGDTSGGGKGKQMTSHRRKALDFTTALQVVSADDTLQDDWGDSFQAFVTAMHSVMCQGVYGAGMLSASADGEGDAPAFDAQAAAETVLEQFSAHLLDLVKQSLAASFVPTLDDDGDSFLDPDGPNAGDGGDDAGYMSADMSGAEAKSGRIMSAANHKAFGGMLAAMKKSMNELTATHKSLTAFHAKVDPSAKPEAAGTDASGDTTSSGGDTPGGKSLDMTGEHPSETPDTSDQTGAGAPESATTPLTADEMGRLIRDRMMAAQAAQATRAAMARASATAQ